MNDLPQPQLALRCPPDIDDAVESWGANCGPTALAAVFGLTMADVHDAVTDDEDPQREMFGAARRSFRRYMNTPQMRRAIAAVGGTIVRAWSKPTIGDLDEMGGAYIVKVQWHGPWDTSARGAAAFTHWIAYRVGYVGPLTYLSQDPESPQDPAWVFDGNIDGGWAPLWWWERVVVPGLLPARGDGRWSLAWAAQVKRE